MEPRSLLGCSVEGGNGAGPGTHSGAGASAGPGPGAKPTILPHPNTCPYVVRTLAAAEAVLGADSDALLAIPSGCDAMRRAGDALKARFDARIFPFSVPRVNDAGSVAALTRDLDRLPGMVGYCGCGGRLVGRRGRSADCRTAVGARC